MKKHLVTLVAALILLNSCGFHLRSSENTPKVYSHVKLLTPNPHSEFSATLSNTLTALGVNQVAKAPITLKITQVSFSHNTPSISTSSEPITYTYTYSVTYALYHKKIPITKPQTATATQTLVLNPSNIITTGPVSVTRNELRRTVINTVVDQLFSLNTLKVLHEDLAKTTQH